MEKEQEFQELAFVLLESLVGKTIEWRAPASRENHPYSGIDKIVSLDKDNPRRPLVCECIEGDELKYAFVDDMMRNEFMSYSDSYRVVTFKIVDNGSKI